MLLKTTPLSFALSGTALLVLSACGGSDDTASPVVPPTPIPLTGNVTVDQGIKNAVVCMDLNANNACDASEPTSARTGADGAYSLVYDPAKVTAAQVADASLIAPMVSGAITDPSSTIDAADPTVANTATPYVLRQSPGKSGQINPLTSLVAAGVTQGMTEAVARANITLQLSIASSKIDNYQDDPVSNRAQVQDNARTMAKITAAALEAGSQLRVGDQAAAVEASPGNLATFRYTDAANYYVRTLDSLAKAAGTTPPLVSDTRSGQTTGVASTEGQLYTQAYLSDTGWVYCNAATRVQSTLGNPSRSTFCNTQASAGFFVATDISGQSMSSVVASMQADPATNTINSGISTTALMAALGTTVFPSTSSSQHRVGVNLTQSIFINNIGTDGIPQTTTSLEELIANNPSSAVNLGTGRGMLGLGLGSSESKSLRVAFTGTSSPTAGTVQFYECDLNSTQTAVSNCIATQSGSYAITGVGGVRVMRYAGHAKSSMNHTRLHAEVKDIPGVASGNRVFVARETKPTLEHSQTASQRLNANAWAAMKSLLGL